MALYGPIMAIFMPPKRICSGLKNSLSLAAKNHNGDRVLCFAFRGTSFIHVDEMMVDPEVVQLVDCANLPGREGLNCQIRA